jgi:hypothetical protein
VRFMQPPLARSQSKIAIRPSAGSKERLTRIWGTSDVVVEPARRATVPTQCGEDRTDRGGGDERSLTVAALPK